MIRALYAEGASLAEIVGATGRDWVHIRLVTEDMAPARRYW